MKQKETGISLTGPDIMPTKDSDRNISNIGFTMLWIGITIQLVVFVSAAQLYPALSPVQILIACLIGNLIVGLLLALTGDIGVKYGIPYAVYIRACFGYLGTHIPAFIRALPAIFWFGFQTWMGAYALNTIVDVLIGYSNLNLFIIVFGIVQIANTAFGMSAIQALEWIAAPTILIVGIIMEVMLLKHYDLTIGSILSIKGEGGLTIGYAVAVMMGNYITMALNAPDFTRFLKVKNKRGSWWQANKGSYWSQNIGLVCSMVLMTFIGITSGVATGNWNPIDVIVETLGKENPFVLVVCLTFVILAQWSSNISANLLPPGYIIVNFFPRKINFPTAAIIAGVIGLVMMPWKFADHTPIILLAISALLSPIVGIMITDYYLLRKRKLNIKELYTVNGQYKYWKNINPAAIIAYIPAGLSVFMFPDFGFVSAFLISSVLYYFLMKYWIVKSYPQPEITDPENFKDVDFESLE